MIFAYTRLEKSETPSRVRADMERSLKAWPEAPEEGKVFSFKTDGQGGKVGLTHTLRQVGLGDVLAIRYLADVARDLHACVKQLVELTSLQGVIIFTTSSKLILARDNPQADVVLALAQAHDRYVRENRKMAISAARQAGATIGRPVAFCLNDVRKTVEDLTNANGGVLPSVRVLAKAISDGGFHCGNTKAMQILHEYKAEGESAEKVAELVTKSLHQEQRFRGILRHT